MHASIDLTRPSSQDSSVNIPSSRPSSSSSSTSSFLETSAYQPHGIDLPLFYRPVYPEQQLATPQYSLLQVFYLLREELKKRNDLSLTCWQERPSSQLAYSVNSAEGEAHYDSVITNGMRVMHFMDHHPPDVFHQYPSLYMPDGLTQYSSGYHVPGGPIPTTDSYHSIPSSASSFSPVVIVHPQPVYYNQMNTNNNVGFQPYQPLQQQQSFCMDLTRDQFDEQKGIKRCNHSISHLHNLLSNHFCRKSSSVSESTGDEMVEVMEDSPPFECSVCGDSCSGIHYGVWACEGCKVMKELNVSYN